MTSYTKKELSQAVAFIKSKRAAVILVCWAHQMIPDMAKLLGVPSHLVPEHWAGKRYDMTWVIKPGDPHPTLTQFPQRLLYGDGDDGIPMVKIKKKKNSMGE